MSNNPGPLPPNLAAQEHIRLASVERTLSEAYAVSKQLYIRAFPDSPRPFVTCGMRSDQEQARLYAQGRTAPGKIVTYSPPGTSKHNRDPSQALDVGFLGLHYELDWTPGQFAEFAKFMLAQHRDIIWGGNFKKFRDLPHFQRGL